MALVEQTGEGQWEAEFHRLRGELLALEEEDAEQVEASFQRALQVSRRQQARSLELRAAVSLARLWQRQGRLGEARQLLRTPLRLVHRGIRHRGPGGCPHAARSVVVIAILVGACQTLRSVASQTGRGRRS